MRTAVEWWWGESHIIIYHIYMLWFKESFVHVLKIESSFMDSGSECVRAVKIVYQDTREQMETLAFTDPPLKWVSLCVQCPLIGLGDFTGLLPFVPFLAAMVVLHVWQGALLLSGRGICACPAACFSGEKHEGKMAALSWQLTLPLPKMHC